MKELEYLSVVILNYNSYEDTVVCVNNLIQFHNGMQIIIVDNCSSDGSYKRLMDDYSDVEHITVIQSDKNGGYSYGNNVGIRYAEQHFDSRIIGILNPDIILDDYSVLEAMCNTLDSHPELAVIGASTLNADGTYNPNNSGWYIPTGWELVRWHFLKNDRKKGGTHWEKISDEIIQVECVAGCFFLAKVQVVKELGYLDENVFLYNEENILGIKCKAAGYLEGVLVDKHYIHNHKYIKGKKIPFKKKINATANVYKSTGYLLGTYYSKMYLPLLFVAELMNKVYLGMAYAVNLLRKSERNS